MPLIDLRSIPCLRASGFSTWRFLGSYKWGYKSLNMVITVHILLITLLITSHEPPSRCLREQDPPNPPK